MLLFHYLMVLNIRQECQLVLISKKSEKFSIFFLCGTSTNMPASFEATIPVGYTGKPLMGTLSSQSRVGIFYADSISGTLRRQRTGSYNPEPNMLLKHLSGDSNGSTWPILAIFNLQERIISSH